MKRNKTSNRSLKFIQRNSPKNEKVKEYIKLLADNAFQLVDYNFLDIDNNIVFQIEDFILLLNEEYVELQLYKKNIKIQEFLGDSCWYQGLKFIKENFNRERRE